MDRMKLHFEKTSFVFEILNNYFQINVWSIYVQHFKTSTSPPLPPHYHWSNFQLHTLYENWDFRKGVYTSIPSTNHVYKQSSTHKRLMEDFHFCAVFVNATCTEFSKPFKTVVRRCSEVAWPATLVKRRLLHRCFYVNFYEFLRAPDL